MMMQTSAEKLLLHNAAIWCSGQEDNSWMVIDQTSGYVVDVGRGTVGEEWAGIPGPRRKDCGGKRILPGLQDSHIHISDLGSTLTHRKVDLAGCTSLDEFQTRIKDFVTKNPSLSWIEGANWDERDIGASPTREHVTAACPDKPCAMVRACMHSVLANSKALEIAGITKDTPNPEGGTVCKYPEDHPEAGQPNGVLLESPAFNMVLQFCRPTKENHTQDIVKALETCVRNGLTSVHALEPGTNWAEYSALAEQQKLPVRVFYSAYYTGREHPNFPAAGQKISDLLSCDRIKIFADGGLGLTTAAMSKCYIGHNHPGLLQQSQETLNQLVMEATGKGYRLEIHVIGDAAADAALTAMQKAQVSAEKRPILTHCQFLRPDLMEKMKQQGVIANIQPQFVPTDAATARKSVPSDLLEHSYPWKTLLEKGIACAGGSDSPVESPTPLLGMYDAIFRPAGRFPVHNIKDQFRPEECLTVQEAIDLYTKGGAYAAMQEHCLGQLLPGYLADFVILDAPQDIVKHPEALLEARAGEVWIAGQRKL